MAKARADRPTETQESDVELREHLDRLLGEVRYGSITLIVQDGRVVQIDVTHKLRLDSPQRGSARRSEAGP